MKKLLLQYGAALLALFAVLYVYALKPAPIEVGDVALVQAKLTKPSDSDSSKKEQKAILAATNKVEIPVKKVDTAKKRILLIGDSMMEGLMFRMKDYTEFNGHFLQPVVWYGSSTKIWGECDTLTHFIKKYKPDYVVVVLGGNELFIRGIESRAPFVKHILKQIGQRPYLWAGPPNWKKDTGINDLIKNNVAQGAYYPSKNLKLARRKDGAHPTRVASAIWMDSLATFMGSMAAAHPIKMAVPPTPTKATPKAVLLRMPQ
jgi:hypothetical protein